ALQVVDPANPGLAAVNGDVGPQPRQFGNVHESVLEDGLADDALARGGGHQGHELRLQVGGEAGIDLCGQVHALQPRAVALDLDAAVDRAGRRAGFLQLVEQGLYEVGAGPGQADLAAGHGGGHGVG